MRTLGGIIATALGLPKATGSELMSPEVAEEYVVRCTRVLYRYVSIRPRVLLCWSLKKAIWLGLVL